MGANYTLDVQNAPMRVDEPDPVTLCVVVEIEGVEWWTRDEVAEHCGISADTVGAYRSRGQMPEPQYVGRTPMWKRAEIESWHARRPGPGNRTPRGQAES